MAKFKETEFFDVEREIVKDGELVTDIIDIKTQKRIIKQIEGEYQVAFPYNESKRKVNLNRLKLYNNQKRDADAVGDNLMFTVFNTIHASLYDDRLQANFEGRSGKGDEDIESNLNALANYDYDLMQKSQSDYFWNWDAEFFGRGLKLVMEFDRTKGRMCPVEEVIDAATWIRDPRANSVNGDMNGKGAMRFGGREVGATYYELKDSKGYFNLNQLKKDKETNSTIDDARQARRIAQGNEHFPQKEESLDKYGNYEFRLLDWFTTFKGQKYLVTLGNTRSIVVRMIKLDDRWPIIDRPLYPMSQDWDGVSIPDLTEDKQRSRAILTNIGLKSAKAEVTPTYLYDKNKIKNKNELNFKVNKFIGVNGPVGDAMSPAQKSTASNLSMQIMEMLDVAAQRSTAATELRQGVQAGKQTTLGEQELAIAGGNKRFSMNAKVYGWSEADFWRQWYRLYKKHFKEEIDEKIIRINGVLSPTWRPLTRENIISFIDPDVRIESKVVSEQKKSIERQSFSQFLNVAIQDPTAGRRFLFKKMGKLLNMSSEELNLAFPPTVDELQAEDENIILNSEKLPKILANDDHLAHIDIHSKADQNPYTTAHIRSHKKMMVTRRDRQDLFQPQQSPQFNQQASGQPQATTEEAKTLQ